MMCVVLFSAFFFSFKKIISAKTRGRKIQGWGWGWGAAAERLQENELLVGVFWARRSLPASLLSVAGVRQRESQEITGGLTVPRPVTTLPGNSTEPMGHRLGQLGPCAHRKERQPRARETVPPGTPMCGSVATHGETGRGEPKWAQG